MGDHTFMIFVLIKNNKTWYTIDALGASFTILDTFRKLLQYFYNTIKRLLQYYYNTSTILLQYSYNISTIILQYFYNTKISTYCWHYGHCWQCSWIIWFVHRIIDFFLLVYLGFFWQLYSGRTLSVIHSPKLDQVLLLISP